MKPQLPLFLSFACFIGFATLTCATPSIAIEPLTEAEQRKLATVETAAKKTTAMLEATETFNTLRKAYQLDRQKFPADRNPELAVRHRKGLANYEMAKKKAMMEVDPSIGSLLQRQAELAKLGMGKANEGETLADSDSSKNLAIKPIKDEPGLPRVLLIGDSISIGYTLQVRERLKGEANVHRIPMNGGATEVGLEKMQAWLGSEKWDVIHFNFGLHDAKYASETTQRASRDEYVANLEKLVVQMKATGARLIFATTTPVPMGGVLSPTRKFDGIEERNRLAVKLMESLDVAIDDLYSIVLPVQEKVGRSNDVHYQPEGYAVLADAVAASIRKELKMIRLSSKRDPLNPTFSLAKPAESEQEKTKVGSAATISILYAEEFQRTEYGHIPNGWRDLIDIRPSRNWIVDGEGLLRPVIKNATGLLVYDGYTAEPWLAKSIANAGVIAEFKKTEDESVKFGVVGRIQDRDNYYLARFGGTQILELIQVKEGVAVPLDAIPLPNTEKHRPTGMMTTRRY